ncbi:MAG: DoxX family protein [Balneolaceae bacterium]
MFLRGKQLDLGLLILRIGLGLLFIGHGYPKVMGGPEKWESVGSAMSYLGIDSLHAVFGFLAASAELFGGIFLILGLYTLPTLIVLLLTMFVAFIQQSFSGAGYPAIAYPLSMATVFIALFFIGPGKKSMDDKLMKRSRRRRY